MRYLRHFLRNRKMLHDVEEVRITLRLKRNIDSEADFSRRSRVEILETPKIVSKGHSRKTKKSRS